MSNSEFEALLKDYRQKDACNMALLTLIPDLVFLMDVHGNYLRFQKGDGFLFIPEDILVGSNINDSGMPTNVVDLIKSQIADTLSNNQLTMIKYELPTPAGGIHYFESRAVKFDQYKIIRLVRDVTEKVLAEKRFLELQETLNKLSALASKELREPLASVKNMLSDILPEHDEASAANMDMVRKKLDLIDLKVQKIIQLIQSIRIQ
jgi:signal transduction histidine kinase